MFTEQRQDALPGLITKPQIIFIAKGEGLLARRAGNSSDVDCVAGKSVHECLSEGYMSRQAARHLSSVRLRPPWHAETDIRCSPEDIK